MIESSLVSIQLSNVAVANINMRFMHHGMDPCLDCSAMLWPMCSLTLRVFQAGQNVYLFRAVKLFSLVVAKYLHYLAMCADSYTLRHCPGLLIFLIYSCLKGLLVPKLPPHTHTHTHTRTHTHTTSY